MPTTSLKMKKRPVTHKSYEVNREKMNAIDDKERYNRSIAEIKETIVKIQKAIEDSVK